MAGFASFGDMLKTALNGAKKIGKNNIDDVTDSIRQQFSAAFNKSTDEINDLIHGLGTDFMLKDGSRLNANKAEAGFRQIYDDLAGATSKNADNAAENARAARKNARKSAEEYEKANNAADNANRQQRAYEGAAGQVEIVDEAARPGLGNTRINHNNVPAVRETAPYSAPSRGGMNSNQARGQFGYSAIKNQELYNINRSFMDRVKDKLAEIWGGSRFNGKTTRARKAYNIAMNRNGGSSYIKSNRQYRNMAKEMGFHGNRGYQGDTFYNSMSGAGLQQGAEITGDTMYGFKKVNTTMNEMTEAAQKASEMVQDNSGILDGIADYFKDNQLATAGALVGGGLIVSSLLDDD